MFEQGYIEILAPTLDTPNAQRVREHMARYGGVHLVCFGTPGAEAERARLAAHGFERSVQMQCITFGIQHGIEQPVIRAAALEYENMADGILHGLLKRRDVTRKHGHACVALDDGAR